MNVTGPGAHAPQGGRERAGRPTPTPQDDRVRLRQLAHSLEAVFLGQMLQVMRESAAGAAGADPAERMFTAMFDECIARSAAGRSSRGPGEALFRQLSRRLEPAAGEAGGKETPR